MTAKEREVRAKTVAAKEAGRQAQKVAEVQAAAAKAKAVLEASEQTKKQQE